MGKTLSRTALFDYGTGHEGPDAGAFQIFANRQFLAIDPLYPGYKLTANYNTMLFKGVGQLGEQTAFGSAEALHFQHYPEIVQTQSQTTYDYVVADVARAYHPALGLRRFRRHLLFVKPNVLLIADEISLDSKGMVYNYAPETLQTSGGLKHAPNDYVIGAQGDAFLVFGGVPGPYQLTAIYLDNVPGAGKYSMVVDGKTIHSWTSKNEDTDDHLLAVSPTVELKLGSRIAFHAEPMAEGCRLVKMTAFSSQVAMPLKAEWLLHFDPNTEIQRDKNRIQACLQGSTADIYNLAPGQCLIQWGLHQVKKPNLEAFTFRETKRLVIQPAWNENSTTMLTLIHTRQERSNSLEQVSAEVVGHTISAAWSSENHRVSLEWNLANAEVRLK